jgi:hypothetical protein
MSQTPTTAEQLSESLEAQMYNRLMSEMSKDVDKVFNALCVDNEQVLGRLPESVFKEYFLPYFAGEIPLTDTSVVGTWVAIAGTPAAEVRVIDDVTQKELFRVPPLMSTIYLDVQTRPSGMPMKDVFEQAAMHRQNIPIQGERYLEAAYADKAEVMLRDAKLPEEYKQRWMDIMNRYGKRTAALPTDVSATSQIAEVIDYDEEVG